MPIASCVHLYPRMAPIPDPRPSASWPLLVLPWAVPCAPTPKSSVRAMRNGHALAPLLFADRADQRDPKVNSVQPDSVHRCVILRPFARNRHPISNKVAKVPDRSLMHPRRHPKHTKMKPKGLAIPPTLPVSRPSCHYVIYNVVHMHYSTYM